MATVEIIRETRARTILPKRFEARPLVSEPTVERVIFIDDCAFYEFGDFGSAYLGIHRSDAIYLSFTTDRRVRVKDSKGAMIEDPKKTGTTLFGVTRNLTLDNPKVSITDPKTNERITFSLDDEARVMLREQLAESTKL